MVANPELIYEVEMDMPDKQGGFICGTTVFLNGNRDYRLQVETLAEEIAHFNISSGNILDLSIFENRKQEAEARRLAYSSLVPLDELIDCFESGIDTPQEFADFFDVSIPFVWKTIDAYKEKYGPQFNYGKYRFDLSAGLNIKKIMD